MPGDSAPPRNFGWLIDGQIAGSGLYWRDDEIAFLRDQGIRLAISLFEQAPPPAFVDALARAGIRWVHAPLVDFSAPGVEFAADVVRQAESAVAAGEPVVISCGAGLGRTGTILACCLVSRGETPEAAIAAVRARRPGSIETPEQERAIVAFAREHRH